MNYTDKDNNMEAFKTYGAGVYAWVVAVWCKMTPHSVGECTDLFNMLAALLALILVSFRFKHDVFSKKRRKNINELEDH